MKSNSSIEFKMLSIKEQGMVHKKIEKSLKKWKRKVLKEYKKNKQELRSAAEWNNQFEI